MGYKYKALVPLPEWLWETEKEVYDGSMDRMMKKNEVCEAFHVSSTNPERHKIFDALTKYENPYNKHAIYKASEVYRLLSSLEIDRSKN